MPPQSPIPPTAAAMAADDVIWRRQLVILLAFFERVWDLLSLSQACAECHALCKEGKGSAEEES